MPNEFHFIDIDDTRLDVRVAAEGRVSVTLWVPSRGENADVLMPEGEALRLRDMLNERFPV